MRQTCRPPRRSSFSYLFLQLLLCKPPTTPFCLLRPRRGPWLGTRGLKRLRLAKSSSPSSGAHLEVREKHIRASAEGLRLRKHGERLSSDRLRVKMLGKMRGVCSIQGGCPSASSRLLLAPASRMCTQQLHASHARDHALKHWSTAENTRTSMTPRLHTPRATKTFPELLCDRWQAQGNTPVLGACQGWLQVAGNLDRPYCLSGPRMDSVGSVKA